MEQAQKEPIKYSETLTKDESLISAGLNWTVSARPIYDSEGREINTHKALTRDDTGKRFAIVSSRYVPFQNDTLFSVVDQFLETGAAKYTGARIYKEGARISARVAIPDADFDVLPNDRCKAVLNISTSHDGSAAIQIVPLVYRLICQNGLHVWEKNRMRTISVKHTRHAEERLLINAREVLGAEIQFFKEFSEKMKALASKEFKRIELDAFLDELLEVKPEEKTSKRLENIKGELVYLTYKGKGQDIPGVRDTAYAVFNGVTEYVTHYKGGQELAREYSELYGSGRELRERAYHLLTR